MCLKRKRQEEEEDEMSSVNQKFPFRRINADHLPMLVSKIDANEKHRLRCRLCYYLDKVESRTSFICDHCQVPLCLNRKRNCFLK